MSKPEVGFLGPEGTWTEEAAVSICPDAVLKPYRNICSIVDDVQNGNLDYGVVPMENSIGGGVVDTLDCLSEVDKVLIIAEKIMWINHVLMSTGRIESINRIFSHSNAVAQCRKSLKELLPHASIEYSASTAEAARKAVDDSTTAVVGSSRLSMLYGLTVLKEGMSDLKTNYTRFVLLGRDETESTGKDRTSICATLTRNEHASLWRFLGVFASLGINLSRIESRPAPESPGEYKFFIDLYGHSRDEYVKTAIEAANSHCSFLRVMGSYPREDWPSTEVD